MADPKLEDQKITNPEEETKKQGELSEEDLASASGGLNPQPLPPGPGRDE